MQAILVLDDSPTMVMSLSRMLKNAGYDVETATNGKEGMPLMDGVAFIKEARKSPATRFTPIIVLTTESSGPKRDEARAAGASAWLTKPTGPNELLSTLKQLLPK
jgi:two-component system chemotaxis response regulator CheY